jgi:hypothetical protein
MMSIPDTLLPEQFFVAPIDYIPEKVLAFAVLANAISTIYLGHNPVLANNRKARRAHTAALEALEWVQEEPTDWPFAFENICHYLNLEPDYIRRGVRAMVSLPRSTSSIRFRRPNNKNNAKQTRVTPRRRTTEVKAVAEGD